MRIQISADNSSLNVRPKLEGKPFILTLLLDLILPKAFERRKILVNNKSEENETLNISHSDLPGKKFSVMSRYR